jgi:outer membrane protein insertion porin family
VEREGRVGLRSPPIRLLPFDPILRLDLVDLRVNAVRYSLNSETLVLGADMRLPGRFKSTLETQLGLVDLECDPNIEPNCNLTPEVRHLEGRPIDVGNLWILSGGPLLIWDRRDNPLNPHQGVFASLRTTLARGGTAPFSDGPREPFSFIKYEAKLTAYIRLAEATLAMSARGGLISLWRSDVPIDQRFFMGGRDSLRGFVEATLIPQDACVGLGPLPKGCAEQLAPSPSGPPLSRGGNSMALLKTELRLPLSDALAASLFIDVGNLWIDVRRARPFAVRMGVGAGLRYATPVGAMAFDLGVNPMPRAAYGEPWTQFHFSLGTF